MSEEKRLYVVAITHSAYVWAASHEDAEDFADEILDNEDFSSAEAREVTMNVLGWDAQALVYHHGEGDLPLRDVLVAPARS
jgi:DNA-binding transcriptional MocR family regulator